MNPTYRLDAREAIMMNRHRIVHHDEPTPNCPPPVGLGSLPMNPTYRLDAREAIMMNRHRIVHRIVHDTELSLLDPPHREPPSGDLGWVAHPPPCRGQGFPGECRGPGYARRATAAVRPRPQPGRGRLGAPEACRAAQYGVPGLGRTSTGTPSCHRPPETKAAFDPVVLRGCRTAN